MINPNLIGLYVGTTACVAYLIYSYFVCKTMPALNQVAVVLLAWTGAVVGINLGYIALSANDAALGVLADQRVAILLGALAVVWTALESFFQSLRAIKKSIDTVDQSHQRT